MDGFKQFCKAGIAKGLFQGRLLNPCKQGRLYTGSGVILQYHSVSHPRSSYHYLNPGLSVTPEDFERQIAFVTRYFRVVSLDQLLANAKDQEICETLFAITFDDGYRDNYIHAFPILRKYDVPATFYLTTECIDGGLFLWTSELRYLILKSPKFRMHLSSLSEEFALDTVPNRMKSLEKIKGRLGTMSRREREDVLSEVCHETGVRDMTPLKATMLNWDDVRTMCRAGMSFGSHTLSHPSLPHIPLDEAKKEIIESRESLSARLGKEISHFSYPNPGNHLNFSTELKQILKNAGYRSATTSMQGYVSHGYDPFELKRKGIYRAYSNLPDFYFLIKKEAILQRLNSFVGTKWLKSSQRTRCT